MDGRKEEEKEEEEEEKLDWECSACEVKKDDD